VTGALTLPDNLVHAAGRSRNDGRRDWIDRLPGIVAGLAERWQLQPGEPFQPGGETAWVAPARGPAGEDLVLKVGWAHPEAEHEADGLRAWTGEGAVVLHADDREGDTAALLLERCRPGTELGQAVPEEAQDEVVAGLLRRLWRTPGRGHPFRPLREMCDAWADQREDRPGTRLDPGLAREGLALFRSLPADADRAVLLVTDLHAGNVLAAEREPWLVIDPKPYVGDPAYDPLQHLLNCPDRLSADPGALADRMADLCGVGRDRLRLWLFARCVVESPWWPGLAEVARRLAPA
jgi:streptomycin 6-kinase